MGEGRRTAKTQAVCQELGPLCSILGFPLPIQSFPPVPRRSHQGCLYVRRSGVLDIFYPQTAYFFRLKMCHKAILCPNVAQKCKTCSRLPEPQKFCFKHQRCSKVTQVRNSKSSFKTNVMENNRVQWNLFSRKGQGIDKILGLPNNGFLLNSLKTPFQSTYPEYFQIS